MKCDFCNNENEDDLIAGRWIFYCKKCENKGGKAEDEKQFWENECCNGERLDNLDGEGQEMILDMF
jgi:hypothetical protein